MTNLLIGAIIGLILGALLGGFIVKWFNVTDYKIDGKYKSKKGGVINIKELFKNKKDGKI